MRVFKYMIPAICIMLMCGCSPKGRIHEDLQQQLTDYVRAKDARIGIAVIIDGTDTIEVNGAGEFPMLSVYKFPIALALADKYRHTACTLDSAIAIMPADLHPDTYSPMTEALLASSRPMTDTLKLPARELLRYMLQQSDNNASDIVLRQLGGAVAADFYLRDLGVKGINIRNSEAEMHADISLCYANSSTPVAMAGLMDKFNREFNDPLSMEIKRMMETCATGTDRLAKPLVHSGAILGHKTGTGFTLPDGRLMAINDAGYVNLPDGRHYSIAVFVENSGGTMATTEAMIADISAMVFGHVSTTACGR